jgi:hypothetical protein
LLIASPDGHTRPARPGRYTTTDGNVIVVSEKGRIAK